MRPSPRGLRIGSDAPEPRGATYAGYQKADARGSVLKKQKTKTKK
jgi:hypothetical protein